MGEKVTHLEVQIVPKRKSKVLLVPVITSESQ